MRLLRMTSEEYRAATEILMMEPHDVMQVFGVTRAKVWQWEKDGPPRSVALFLRLVLAQGMTVDQAVEECAGFRFAGREPPPAAEVDAQAA